MGSEMCIRDRFHAVNSTWGEHTSGITLDDYANGYTLFCFDLTPSLTHCDAAVELTITIQPTKKVQGSGFWGHRSLAPNHNRCKGILSATQKVGLSQKKKGITQSSFRGSYIYKDLGTTLLSNTLMGKLHTATALLSLAETMDLIWIIFVKSAQLHVSVSKICSKCY